MTAHRTLVIGCGNVLRGDDAAGPVLVRRLWERGLPEGVRCADGGTGGMDVAFQMRGVAEVILVDACRSGSEPGSLFEVPGDEVENLPPLTGINLHAFRWDHAIAFARWLLKDDYPAKVTAYLVEGERFEVGAGLSPPVDEALDRLAELLLARFAAAGPPAGLQPAETVSPAPACPALPRPQPVGIFPFPASHLLLPACDEPAADEVLRRLLQGDLATELPGSWRFFAAAARGDVAGALALVAGDDPIAAYNRFVLAPSAAALAAIEAGDPVLAALARSAAFAHGLCDDVAAPALDGELQAAALVTQAAARIEQRRLAEAAAALEAAAEHAAEPSPLLAALALQQLADLAPALDPPRDPLPLLRRAVELAAAAALPLFRAELLMKLGVALQQAGGDGDRPQLIEAIKCYQQALAEGLTTASAPQAYVQLQNNLGLAYLATPTREASDQLRTGIAVQSFREALRGCDRTRDPDTWASVQMNLASALQYLPSAHPAENLAQAVEAYEEVLQVRTEARDPVAHGRVLLNQANALAHLGIFKPAIEKLATAMKLLSWYGHDDEAAAARELLAGIEERLDELRAPVGESALMDD